MLKYARRYALLLILVILLVPLRYYLEGSSAAPQANGKYPPSQQSNDKLLSDHSQALYGIAGLPNGEVWAVGGSFTVKSAIPGKRGSFPLPTGGTILHYADNTWSIVRVNGPLGFPLLSVSLDSPRDGWAVGWAGTFIHFDGKQWSTKPGPANFRQNVLSVMMLSANDGWAVGYSGTILHYNGSQWAQVTSPTTIDLRSIALTSPDEGWAIGDSGTILHYQKGNWSLFSPAIASSTLNSITMLSANEGWIVGSRGTILHYRDGIWERVHPAGFYQNPTHYQSVDFSAISMSSIRSGWIAGDQHLLTYNSEAWIEPGPINNSSGMYAGEGLNNFSISAILLSPTGDCWAVGNIAFNNGKTYSDASVILHYQANTWNVYLISST